MTMYSVLLVDDEKIIREGVYELLSMADLDLDLAMAAFRRGKRFLFWKKEKLIL